MMIFRPTEEEFKNPIDYVEKLYHHYEAGTYGCVKVTPPPSFSPKCVFDKESDRKLPTRF